MSRRPDTVGLELAGLEEAAAMLGVDEETVAALHTSEALARTGTPFPRPLAELSEQGPVWDRAHIAEWQRARSELWRRTRSGPLPTEGAA